MTPPIFLTSLISAMAASRRGCLGFHRRRSIQPQATRYPADYLHLSPPHFPPLLLNTSNCQATTLIRFAKGFVNQKYNMSVISCTARTLTVSLPLAQAGLQGPDQGRPLTCMTSNYTHLTTISTSLQLSLSQGDGSCRSLWSSHLGSRWSREEEGGRAR